MASTAGLAPSFKTRVEELLAAAGGRVSIVSGFRTYQQQLDLRRKNGCPDIYHSPSSACRVPTAIPGTSQHEKGLAVDFGGDLALAQRLAAQVGLKPTVKGEPWHFEPVEANARTRARDGIVAIGTDPRHDDEKGPVDRFIDGFRRLTITGLIVTGAAAIVVMGGYRTVTGRSIAGDTTKAAVKVGAAVATDGASLAAGGATKGATSPKPTSAKKGTK